MPTTRRLAAVLAADIVGYSRLIRADEEATHTEVMRLIRDLAAPRIKEDNGRLIKTTGDGLLAEFSSVVDAVRSGIALQRAMADRYADVAIDRRIQLRVGINLGDIIVEPDDIYGDGVNLAFRLEGLAEPGGICVSANVHEEVRDKLDLAFVDLGGQQVKNIARPVHVYRILFEGQSPHLAQTAPPSLPDKPSIAVLPFRNLSGDPEQEYFADGMVEEIITDGGRCQKHPKRQAFPTTC